MKLGHNTLRLRSYKAYIGYGAVGLLQVYIVALLAVTFLPEPFHLDFFGVVAEKTSKTASVSIGWSALLIALVIFPLCATLVERHRSNK